jgi:hypothetical protein
MTLLVALLIAVLPLVVFPHGSIRLTCTVPRDVRNRLLSYGIVDYSASERDLDGERAAITWPVWYTHLPSGVGLAYCAVTNDVGKVTRRTQPFLMVADQ